MMKLDGSDELVASTHKARARGLSLILLMVAYGLVGWNLAAHHIIWVVGFLIIALAITVSWAGSNWVKKALSHIPKALLLALAASVMLSLSFTSSLFLTLALTPLLTTFFAWNEIQSSSPSQIRTSLIIVSVAVLSLGMGELLDLWVLPSARY
jgi:hypothetical protein